MKLDIKAILTTDFAHSVTYPKPSLIPYVTSCHLGAQIRMDTRKKIQEIWVKKTKDPQMWALNSHYLTGNQTPQGWEEWRYWLGLVPIVGWQRTTLP